MSLLRIVRTSAPMLLAVVALWAAAAWTTPARAAAMIVEGRPCGGAAQPNFYCFETGRFVSSLFGFTPLTFQAPSKGTAQVLAHGTIWCRGTGTGPRNRTVSIKAKILRSGETSLSVVPGVTDASMTVANNGAGTLNIASNRVVAIPAASTERVSINFELATTSPDVICVGYNMALTVIFVP